MDDPVDDFHSSDIDIVITDLNTHAVIEGKLIVVLGLDQVVSDDRAPAEDRS